jgi:pyridoxal phosphate enzyme (YggS family)
MDAAGPDLINGIRERYARVQDRIEASARKVGRSPDSVRLVVVTKSQPLPVVQAALQAGVRILGENYADEAVAKIEALHGTLEPPALGEPSKGQASPKPLSVEWHMIGHVQSRKAKLVARHFALIHSVDSVKLAERLNQHAGALRRRIDVLLEFNVGGEVGKSGWAASEEATWPRLLEEARAVANLPNLSVHGLMSMPPLTTDPEDARKYFRKLLKLRHFLSGGVERAEWSELSMGTSADFSVAVEEGATLVRVGEAILGPRPAREHQ